MTPYHQRVPIDIRQYVPPEDFDQLRLTAVYDAYQSLLPHEQKIVLDLAKDLAERVSLVDENFSFRDALYTIGVASAGFLVGQKTIFNESPKPDSREQLFFAVNPRRLIFEDFTEEELEELAELKPTEICEVYDINMTVAKSWYHRARAYIRKK